MLAKRISVNLIAKRKYGYLLDITRNSHPITYFSRSLLNTVHTHTQSASTTSTEPHKQTQSNNHNGVAGTLGRPIHRECSVCTLELYIDERH